MVNDDEILPDGDLKRAISDRCAQITAVKDESMAGLRWAPKKQRYHDYKQDLHNEVTLPRSHPVAPFERQEDDPSDIPGTRSETNQEQDQFNMRRR